MKSSLQNYCQHRCLPSVRSLAVVPRPGSTDRRNVHRLLVQANMNYSPPGFNASSGALQRSGNNNYALQRDGEFTERFTNVRFGLKFKASYGQSVKLLGSHPFLGSWTLKHAVELKWSPGDLWIANVQLPTGGIFEYKYVLVDYTSKEALEWQQGSNAVLAIDVNDTSVEVLDNWGNNPGAKVDTEDNSLTREGKLQKWAGGMRTQWKEAQRLQIELTRKQDENVALRSEGARLKMELSLAQASIQERDTKIVELTAKSEDLQIRNLVLEAQLTQKTKELSETLSQALQLLSSGDDDDEYEDYEIEEVEEYEDDDFDPGNGGSHSFDSSVKVERSAYAWQ